MSRISVNFDQRQFAEAKALLDGLSGRNGFSAFQVGAQAAISKTITFGKAQIARVIGQEVKLPIGEIKKLISSGRGSYRDPSGWITLTRKPVKLIRYMSAKHRGAVANRFAGNIRRRPPAGGLKISVRKRSQGGYTTREVLPHAFFAVTPKSQHLGIFVRTGEKRVMKMGRYEGKVREVIKNLQGPTALGVFVGAKGRGAAATLMDEVGEDMKAVLSKNLDSQIHRFLKTRKA